MRWYQVLILVAVAFYLVWGAWELIDWVRTERRIRRTERLWAAVGPTSSGLSTAARGAEETEMKEHPPSLGPSSGPPRITSTRHLIRVLGWHGTWLDV